MEIIKKKIIFWVSLASSMAVVLIIWLMSLKSYNFSESKEQIQEIKEQVQEKLQDIKIPEMTEPNSVGAGHVLPDEKTPLSPEASTGEAKLKLPLSE